MRLDFNDTVSLTGDMFVFVHETYLQIYWNSGKEKLQQF